MTCDYCTGSHYLSDVPGLGPCACCTPEALQRVEGLLTKRDETIKAMSAAKTLPELLDEMEGLATDVRDRMAELENQREDDAEQIADAIAALQNHLVSIGLDARPVVTPDGPLGVLCKVLEVCA